VSAASVDLDSLVGQLNLESSDASEKAAKRTLSSVLETVIAKAKEASDVSQHNIELLEQAVTYGQILDMMTESLKHLTETYQQIQKETNAANRKLKELKAKEAKLEEELKSIEQEELDIKSQIEHLNAVIATTTDAATITSLNEQLSRLEMKLSNTMQKKASIQTKMNNNAAEISQVNETVADCDRRLAEVNASIAEVNGKIAEAKAKIDETLSGVKDVSVIEALANALKIDASDVMHLIEDKNAERSDEQEKYLDAHSIVRIIQDAINNHDAEILDEIDKKTEKNV
jgi:chromosome segregation ATPase